MSSSDEQLSKDPPIPAPGWICTAAVEKKESTMQQVQMGNRGMGMMAIDPGVVEAIVVSIGDFDDAYYEEHTDEDRVNAPFTVSSKVYYTADQGLEINGYTYLHFNRVFAWEPAPEE